MEHALTHPSRLSQGTAVSRPPVIPFDRQGAPGNSSSGWSAVLANSSSCGAEGPAAAGGSTDSSPGGKPAVLAASAADWGHDAEAHGGDDEAHQEEEPARSPLRHGAARDLAFQEPLNRELLAGGSDPLGDGLGLLAGIAIGLLTLVVPVLSVISDRTPGSGFSVDTNSGSGRLLR